MPIHYNIEKFKLEDEIYLIQKAGFKVTFILPELIQHIPNGMLGSIIRYIIIFEKEDNEKKE